MPQFETDFVLNFAMCSADFTCVNGSTIQIVFSELLLRILTFWILNKNFQETASLSVVLSLFIHKISSKHDSGYNIQAEFELKCFSHSLHASLFAKMSGSGFGP